MATVRAVALALCALVLAGCGGSSGPAPPPGGATLRLALPLVPRTLDPAKVADLPSLNVAHELYAGLTRFSGTGVAPDLAQSWDVEQSGLVWTFHLRKGIRWSDGAPITAEDFRRSWLRALAPETQSAYARAEMQNIRGARRYRVTGSGEVGVEAVDERTLRVTLQHPVPWLDEQVAWPVFAPLPRRGDAVSGPFRLAARSERRVVLERNRRYWNARAVRPRRIVLATTGADGMLPRGVLAPGFPWVATAKAAPREARELRTLSVELLWLPLSDENAREIVLSAASRALRRLAPIVPPAMPGFETIVPRGTETRVLSPERFRVGLAYTTQDPRAAEVATRLRDSLATDGVTVTLKAVPTVAELVRLAGPPAQPAIGMVLLGWSAEFFDAYNIFDLFPCASAFNVAGWCDRSYDALMHRAVRTLDDSERYRIERELVRKLDANLPAVALWTPTEHVLLRRGARGFRWSPIGIYELMGMTRS